ncbi:MAG TPA: cation diffusion facilitator family transporter [Bacillota bacterium]|jgi:cation diffusion facilitator family transporter
MLHHDADVSPSGFPADDRTVLRAAHAGLALNVLLAAAKIAAGVVGRSDALLADGLHSSADAAAALAVAVGLKISRRPADADHPHGHAKAEGVAALIVGVVLAVAGLEIGFESIVAVWSRTGAGPGRIVLYVAGVSIVLKEAMYRYQSRVARRRRCATLLAAAAEHRTCAMKTLVTLLSVGGARLGLRWLDPAAGLFIAVLVAAMALQISRRAVEVLMDQAPGAVGPPGVPASPGASPATAGGADGRLVIEAEVRLVPVAPVEAERVEDYPSTAAPPPPM